MSWGTPLEWLLILLAWVGTVFVLRVTWLLGGELWACVRHAGERGQRKQDPPQVPMQRQHPATKNPAELKDIPAEAPIGQVAERPPREPRRYLPGEWGGPYL